MMKPRTRSCVGRFDEADANGDGKIDSSELQQCACSQGDEGAAPEDRQAHTSRRDDNPRSDKSSENDNQD